MTKQVITREEFKARWDSNAQGGGITYNDIAECAIAWGINSYPRTAPIDLIKKLVVKASGVTT